MGEQEHFRFSSASASPKTHKGERNRVKCQRSSGGTQTHTETLLCPSPAPTCKLQHSELLFVIRAAEQRCRAAALTFSKVVPLNFSISTCLHAGYGACHVTRARFQGRAAGEAQQPSRRVSGWGGRQLFAGNQSASEEVNLNHTAPPLTAENINRAVFSCSLPLLIIAQIPRVKYIHTAIHYKSRTKPQVCTHAHTHTHTDILLEHAAYIQYLKCHFLNINAMLLARFMQGLLP